MARLKNKLTKPPICFLKASPLLYQAAHGNESGFCKVATSQSRNEGRPMIGVD